jgi:hypothetical protein
MSATDSIGAAPCSRFLDLSKSIARLRVNEVIQPAALPTRQVKLAGASPYVREDFDDDIFGKIAIAQDPQRNSIHDAGRRIVQVCQSRWSPLATGGMYRDRSRPGLRSFRGNGLFEHA